MKAVILAGGLGTRISEETSIKPKPMVEIGGKPILWSSIDFEWPINILPTLIERDKKHPCVNTLQ